MTHSTTIGKIIHDRDIYLARLSRRLNRVLQKKNTSRMNTLTFNDPLWSYKRILQFTHSRPLETEVYGIENVCFMISLICIDGHM